LTGTIGELKPDELEIEEYMKMKKGFEKYENIAKYGHL
jgi:hypothetical protein